MAYNNSDLVHAWAQQNKETGRNGRGDSLHFSGRSLYSYRTEIARFIDGRAVYTSHTYSVTTSGKHQRHVPGAVSHVENYRVSLEMKQIPDRWSDAAPIIFADMLRSLKSAIESLLRARSSIEWQAEQIAENARAAWSFFANYINDHDFNAGADAITIGDLSAISSNVAGFDIVQALQERFGAALKDKIAKQRAADKARREKIALENAAALDQWRSHENSRTFYDMPIALRVSANGEEIETTRGARIPRPAAVMFWRGLEAGADMTGRHLGAYTISAITADRVVVGCHDIPREEIEKIARALRLV